MIKKYIRGSKDNGSEIIKLLESLGGKNLNVHDGCSDSLYFINPKTGVINSANEDSVIGLMILDSFEELTLEKVEPKSITLTTAKRTNICEGCEFQGYYLCMLLSSKLLNVDCEEENVIFIKA